MTGKQEKRLIVVTGANGAVGQAILRRSQTPLAESLQLVAAVRSDRAAMQVVRLKGIRTVRVDYEELETLDSALAETQALIHLPGVLIERPDSSYEQSNVETTQAVVNAAKHCGLDKLVLVSAFGADAASANRFFRSKGQAEEIVRQAGLPYTILRAPLVLGPLTEGARALARSSAQRWPRLLGGGRNLQQPLDVEDLAEGALRAASQPELALNQTLELAGPECLSERELVQRAAQIRGKRVRLGSIPVGLMRRLLALRTRFRRSGFSPDVLEVILADTRVDPRPASEALGIQLTPFDDTIRSSLDLPEDP